MYDSTLCYGDWVVGGKGTYWVNFVLTANCVRGLDRGMEGKGVGELCVDSRLC